MRRWRAAVLLTGLQAVLFYRAGMCPCLLNWLLLGALAFVACVVLRRR